MKVIANTRWGQQSNQAAPAPATPNPWLGTARFWPVGSLLIAAVIPWVPMQVMLGHVDAPYSTVRLLALLAAVLLTAAHGYLLWTRNKAIWWPVASTAIAVAAIPLDQMTYFAGLYDDALTPYISAAQVAAYVLGQALFYEYVCGIPVTSHHKVKMRPIRRGRWVPGTTSFDHGFHDNITGETPGYFRRSADDYEVVSESFGRRGDGLPTAPEGVGTAASSVSVSLGLAWMAVSVIAVASGILEWDPEVTTGYVGYPTVMISPTISFSWLLVAGACWVMASLAFKMRTR